MYTMATIFNEPYLENLIRGMMTNKNSYIYINRKYLKIGKNFQCGLGTIKNDVGF